MLKVSVNSTEHGNISGVVVYFCLDLLPLFQVPKMILLSRLLVSLCLLTAVSAEANDDDDIYHGHKPEMKQLIAFREAGGWSSFCFAGTFLVVQVYWMPENRRQMRPRMLLILLGFDAFAGLFFGLADAPAFVLPDQYDNHDNASVANILDFLA